MLALGASPETSCHPTASDTPTEQIRESRLERPSNTHRAVWEVGETLGLNLALWASCSSPPTIGGVGGGHPWGSPGSSLSLRPHQPHPRQAQGLESLEFLLLFGVRAFCKTPQPEFDVLTITAACTVTKAEVTSGNLELAAHRHDWPRLEGRLPEKGTVLAAWKRKSDSWHLYTDVGQRGRGQVVPGRMSCSSAQGLCNSSAPEH
jgi:hypothetical protein